MTPEFSVSIRNIPDFHILALHGDLDMASAPGLADVLKEIAGSTVVVDLSDLTFMDSSGISALVVARNQMEAEGKGDLVVTRPEGILRRVLEIVGLSEWIVDWSPAWGE